MTRLHAISIGFFLMSAGCGSQPYPATLAYPPRADAIVARLPDNPPDGPPAAGKLDEFIDQINQRGGKTYDPNSLWGSQKAKLQLALGDIFGSPAAPTVVADGESQAFVEQLQLQPAHLAKGSRLYKKHCLQCHGLTGDGRGPTGQWVYPFPRDFRQGIYKYVSSAGSAARKPTRADLHRVINVGIDRTSMPAFALLSEIEREQIVSYIIHLGLRGEVEYRTMLGIVSGSDDFADDFPLEVRSRLKIALRQWVQADAETITSATMPTPEDPEARMTEAHFESVRRGQRLFAHQATGCVACHVDYGRQSRYLYDAWGGSVRPADLTEGAFRGGKTPLDLYHRIRGGIGASGMPATATLTESQVWDLVHFVQALPYQRMLPPDVREQVYPER